MLIVAFIYGCTLISDEEVDAKFGDLAPDADTGIDSGQHTDTGADTAEDTSADTALDTSTDSGTDTSADTAVDTGVDTGVDPRTDYISAAGGTMLFLPGGTFSMGSGLGDPVGAYVDHDVTLTHDFYLAQTETTRGEWETDPANTGWAYGYLPDYPCTGTTTECPADTMTWYDAAMYANWLSLEEGLTACYLADGTDMAAAFLADPYSCPGYRLPTEAEWEYAARAGVDTTYAGSDTSTDVAWTYESAYLMGTYAHEACSLAANAWRLCDMSGNVWEWTNDWTGTYDDASAAVDPAGPLTGSGEGYEGTYRVLRGGGWPNPESASRVVGHTNANPSGAGHYYGFRLARSLVP